MPKSDLNEHFEDQRKEWTGRKHELVARYFVPAAMKMKSINGRVALIDGYAGPNEYGGEIKGSTAIMIEAARRVRAQGVEATVYACEPDAGRYKSLTKNLSGAIEEGILHAFNSTHSECLAEIKQLIGNAAAIVFLDPQTSSELTLDGDIQPWAVRPLTDVLGVFMGGDACRVCASAIAEDRPSEKMVASLGPNWRAATTEDTAYEVFFDSIRAGKKFSGLYRLRKQEPRRNAYGVFGLSDSAHGMWLLSEAIAKDWGVLKEFDAKQEGANLFTEVNAEDDQKAVFEALVALCRPFVERDNSLSGSKLAIEILKTRTRVDEMFGKYVTSDFTKAAKVIRGPIST